VKQVNTEVYASDRYDVQFFKNTSSKVPVWTKFVSNDPATMSGYVGGKYHQLKGHDMGVTVQKGNYAVPAYRAVDVSIIPGMPGGPVTNDAGEVIGMTTELGLEPLEYGEGTYNVSYYLPYEVIAKEWKNYQLIKAGEDPIK
jgi:V8-like Glu-specific endopeptidase